MKMLLAVAAGGAAGAVARYLAMSGIGHWFGMGFPYGTLAVNVAGSIVLGALVEIMALVWSVGLEMRAFLVVGVLGSFTTFSTFSLDVVVLIQRGEVATAGLYMVASVVLAVAGFMAGLYALRLVLT